MYVRIICVCVRCATWRTEKYTHTLYIKVKYHTKIHKIKDGNSLSKTQLAINGYSINTVNSLKQKRVNFKI